MSMEDGGRWHSGNTDLDLHVAVNSEPPLPVGGCDQEDLTTIKAPTAPVSMAHLEQFTDNEWSNRPTN